MTPTTPLGKLDDALNPLELFLALGVGFVASMLSTRPKDLAAVIGEAMEYPGFAIVHVQSPCTTYNDTYAALKGNPKEGIEPAAYPLPEDHDPTSKAQAMTHAVSGRIPVGLLYRRPESTPMHGRLAEAKKRAGQTNAADVEELLSSLVI